MTVPFVDLSVQHRQIRDALHVRLDQLLASTAFVGGPEVVEFEGRYAEYAELPHCVGVASGTDALELALRAAGVGPGDRVVIPANSFVATAEAVVRAGAAPVFVDCDPEFLQIDIDRAAEAVRRTGARAVVPVHLFGQLVPVEALRAAVGDDVLVVEDAAESHGARRRGRRSFEGVAAAATSFYPGKNLGAYGDGGAVLTQDDTVAARVRAMRNHGGTERYQHDVVGWTSRLDAIQAVVLNQKVPLLDRWNEQRREAAARYRELLHPAPEIELPAVREGNECVWHLFVVRVDRRDDVAAALGERGVATGIHYPTPIHLTGAFADHGDGPGSCPVAEAAARRILSLPMFPGITPAQQEWVAECLLDAVAR